MRVDLDGEHDVVSIDPKFHGPPGSGNGGYTCGLETPIEGSAAVVWRWRGATAHAGGDGRLRPEVVWAALDCPGGMAWMRGGDQSESGPLVLGQLWVAIFRRPTVAEELVVSGWQDGAIGRRRHSGTAAWTRDDELIAQGAAIWIRLDADQAAAFAASSTPPA